MIGQPKTNEATNTKEQVANKATDRRRDAGRVVAWRPASKTRTTPVIRPYMAAKVTSESPTLIQIHTDERVLGGESYSKTNRQ